MNLPCVWASILCTSLLISENVNEPAALAKTVSTRVAYEFLCEHFSEDASSRDLSVMLLRSWLKARMNHTSDSLAEFTNSIRHVAGDVPDWWRFAVENSGHVEASPPLVSYPYPTFPFVNRGDISSDTSIYLQSSNALTVAPDGRVYVVFGDERAFVPKVLFDSRPMSVISAEKCGEIFVLAEHSPRVESTYKLVRIHPALGQVVWQTEVWAVGFGLLEGIRGHKSEIVITPKLITIYGQTPLGVYAESFLADSGVPVFRFSSMWELAALRTK